MNEINDTAHMAQQECSSCFLWLFLRRQKLQSYRVYLPQIHSSHPICGPSHITRYNTHCAAVAFASCFYLTCRQLVFRWKLFKPYGLDFLLSHALVHVGGVKCIHLFVCSLVLHRLLKI